MANKILTQRSTVPEAFVTKGKQRLKQYSNNIVYLHNNEEFELELFNPTQSKILAKIKFNNDYISYGGIVLRPGERVFIERFLDDAKKFVFNTYDVNKDESNIQEIIENNGNIEVEFYEESKPCVNVNYIYPYIIYPNNPFRYYPEYKYRLSETDKITSWETTYNTQTVVNNVINDKNSIETGRIESGNYSDQSFSSDNSSFNLYHSWIIKWKILPESQKIHKFSDIRVYCTNCGARRKKSSFKFCPNCGTKF